MLLSTSMYAFTESELDNNPYGIDYTEISNDTAELDPDCVIMDSTNHVLSKRNYDVKSKCWYILNKAKVGVGVKGWTNLILKSDGTYLKHYTRVRAWIGKNHWDSEREWGKGKIYASTGNVGQGAISAKSIYYGINNK
ncbi:MAG: hypothetical protein Q4F79_00550 [Eubacteriales bacterium]|nr:hypothetical protein [Eubacteriales bacterium]